METCTHTKKKKKVGVGRLMGPWSCTWMKIVSVWLLAEIRGSIQPFAGLVHYSIVAWPDWKAETPSSPPRHAQGVKTNNEWPYTYNTSMACKGNLEVTSNNALIFSKFRQIMIILCVCWPSTVGTLCRTWPLGRENTRTQHGGFREETARDTSQPHEGLFKRSRLRHSLKEKCGRQSPWRRPCVNW